MSPWFEEPQTRLDPGVALVVDDSRAMRLLLARSLNRCGFRALEAGDGFAAMDLLDSLGVVSLLLVDWTMPTMSGVELIRRIREDQRFADVPVLMVSSETAPDRMGEALEAGADDYLMKPFDAAMLVSKLVLLGFEIADPEAMVEA